MAGKKKPIGGLPTFDGKKPARDQIQAAAGAAYAVSDGEVDARRYGGDLAKARDAKAGEKRSKAVAGLRSAAALHAWTQTPSGGVEPFAVDGVAIREVRPFADDADQVIGVEVFLHAGYDAEGKPRPTDPNEEAHYRIVNPPTLVRDDSGPVEVGGRRYREDPLGAIAHAISTVRKGRAHR